MASILGSSIISSVFGHTEAEKAFRTWWDTLEDSMIYGMVVLGLLVIPTAIIMDTPLSCNYCKDDICGEQFINAKIVNNETVALEDPSFSSAWAKKYCTLNGSVDAFMLYFPYILLISAISLVLIERVFVKMFKTGHKMEKFYNILMHQNVLGKNASGVNTIEANSGGEAVELMQCFYENNNFYVSHLIRTFLKIVVVTNLLIIMCIEGFPSIDVNDLIHCNIHGYWYECSGAPNQFYLYILYITVFIDAFYVVINIYNLFWLICPGIGTLNTIMKIYRENLLRSNKGKSEKEILGDLYHIYYNNRDLRLLLELLTISSGIAPAISTIAFFDKGFQNATKPTIININVSKELGIVRLEFQEAKSIVRTAIHRIPSIHLMYVAELVPPGDSTVKTFPSQDRRNGKKKKRGEKGRIGKTGKRNEMEMKSAVFTGLKNDIDYSVKVSNVVNGRTISQVTQQIRRIHETVPKTLNRLVDEDAIMDRLSQKNHNTISMPLEKIEEDVEVYEENSSRAR